MAGTLTISSLSDGTNTGSVTDAIKGSAKAWVKFNGVTTATINASYNVSSVVRNATGDYTINFTTSFSDGNYVVTGTSSKPTGPSNYSPCIKPGTSPTTSTVNITTGDYNSNQECSQVCIAIFR